MSFFMPAWIARGVGTLIPALAASGAWLAALKAPEATRDERLTLGPVSCDAHAFWLGIGIVLTIVAVIIPTLQSIWSIRVANDVERELITAIDDILGPIVSRMAELTSLNPADPRRPMIKGEVLRAVLEGLPRLLANRTRAVYYELCTGPPRQLAAHSWSGRSKRPSTLFMAGTPVGDRLLGVLDNENAQFIPNAAKDPLTGADHAYSSHISVPVATTVHPFGVLTVDAVSADDLNSNDVPMVVLFGRLLALTLGA